MITHRSNIVLLTLLLLSNAYHPIQGQVYEIKNHTADAGETIEGKKIAVLHVGPHKTGTSAIQSVSNIFIDVFREDSYIIVDYDHDFIRGMGQGRPTHSLAMCTCPAGTKDFSKCDEGLIDAIKYKLPSDWNLILSHEAMDHSCIDAAKVQSVLYPKWDVKVVVAYRRFYQWIVSFYKQTHRTDIGTTAHAKQSHVWPNVIETNNTVEDMKSWLTRENIMGLYNTVYSTAVYDRYDAVFDNVSILNIHDVGGDLVGSFICDQVPHATHACHEWKTNNIQPPDVNRAAVTFYDEIALAAYFEGYLSDDISRDEARERIQQHQEQDLSLTAEDFPKICAEHDLMDLVLDLSLKAEETMVPEFFQSELGEAALRSEFDSYTDTRFCSIDYDELWKQNDWVVFFKSLIRDGVGSSNGDIEVMHVNDEFIETEEEKWDENEEMKGLKRHRLYLRP